MWLIYSSVAQMLSLEKFQVILWQVQVRTGQLPSSVKLEVKIYIYLVLFVEFRYYHNETFQETGNGK